MFATKFRELLLMTPGLYEEFDAFQKQLRSHLLEEHNEDGTHAAITCDSLATKDGVNHALPITGALRFLQGGVLFDAINNVSHKAVIRPPQITANQNDYDPDSPALKYCFGMEVESDAARTITGFRHHVRQKRLFLFGNRGNFNITLVNNSSSSAAENRLALANGGADLVVGSGTYVLFFYDVGSQLWRRIAGV